MNRRGTNARNTRLLAPKNHLGDRRPSTARPAAGYRARGTAGLQHREAFAPPEAWYEPNGQSKIRYIREPAGPGYYHPVTLDEVRERIAQMPPRLTRMLEVVQLSRITRKRVIFPCYGMQWGSTVYLYPIEATLIENYVRPPGPQQLIEAKMYGGRWCQDGEQWRLEWTKETIRDYYLNNIQIHEIGHINDERNSTFADRERYADWFAIEYGYRASRGRK